MSAFPSEMFTGAFEHGSSSQDLPPVPNMYPHVLAYLSQTDAATTQLTHQPEFRHQLDTMLKEVEAHRHKMATFLEEFSRVQTENMHLRTYLNSQLPSRLIDSGPSNFSALQAPSSDTTGKSWDSIVLDLI
ncbi:hypothetical protein N7495_009208 [Penicillium taxi]|uniref:uncharacterized protein n=1 Tax=Penicillium taxi TaxID=168475 RepID=UPI002545AAC0|nr:uncharacterized protein N7495_009208 [Penicillium taxi]KAJ5884698.1 hypothetical protein N7495_009208 [Penicillium taxi]